MTFIFKLTNFFILISCHSISVLNSQVQSKAQVMSINAVLPRLRTLILILPKDFRQFLAVDVADSMLNRQNQTHLRREAFLSHQLEVYLEKELKFTVMKFLYT